MSLEDLLKDKDKNLPKIKTILRKILKQGGDLTGYYELVQSLGKPFQSQYGRWARRRGRNFEVMATKKIQEAFKDSVYHCISYRSSNEKCATQLYDLVLYIRDRPPLFIECKTGGVIQNSKGVRIDRGHRALKNLKEREILLRYLYETLNPSYFFYFGGKSEVLIPLSEILRNEHTSAIERFYLIKTPKDIVQAYEEEW